MQLFNAMEVAITNLLFFLSTFFIKYFHPLFTSLIFFGAYRLMGENEREHAATLDNITID